MENAFRKKTSLVPFSNIDQRVPGAMRLEPTLTVICPFFDPKVIAVVERGTAKLVHIKDLERSHFATLEHLHLSVNPDLRRPFQNSDVLRVVFMPVRTWRPP